MRKSDYRFVVTRGASRELRRCPKREVLLAWLDRLCDDPFAPDNNVKPLTGVPDGFRRRFGDWRVSYLIDQEARVFEVQPRGGAYR